MKKALMPTGNLTVCPNPLRLDSYDGCSGQCAYCFARVATLSHDKHDSFATVQPRERRIGPAIKGEGSSPEAGYIRMGLAVHMGGMADPFQPAEREHRVTLDHLEQLREARAPLVVSTKFDLLREEPWLSAWKRIERKVLQVSLIACDDRLTRIEPGAPTWSERLEFVREMAETAPVVVRIQPYIEGLSGATSAKLCEAVAECGGRGIIVEGLKVPTRWRKKMESDLRGVLGRSWEPPSAGTGGDRDYPNSVKFRYQLETRRQAKAHGLRHYAADNPVRWLGDSPLCCATDLMEPTAGHWPANWGHVCEEARRSGEVRFPFLLGSIAEQGSSNATSFKFNAGNGARARNWDRAYGESTAELARQMSINPGGFNRNTGDGAKARNWAAKYGGKQTLGAWYRWVWNQTRAGRGPQSVMPNLVATHKDENDDAVYQFVLSEKMREAVYNATGDVIEGGLTELPEEAKRVSANAS